MKITFNWLKKHMIFQEKNILSLLEDIEGVLIKLGLELESYQFIDPIFAMKISKCEKVPDTKLSLCEIEIPTFLRKFFKKDKISVICGAKNAREGIITAFCPPGTYLGPNLIEEKKIAGILSEGMFTGSESGIEELSEEGVYQFRDILLDITVPTNRWDLKNVRSLARNLCFFEIGILKDLPIKIINDLEFPFPVQNESNVLASFVCINNIQLSQEVISLMKSIKCESNLLQMLNDFVLLDIGHPIHIYDKNDISDISIEKSIPNFELETFAGKFITTGKELIIKSDNKIISVGGISGCKGYNSYTKDVVIESIYFDPDHISKVINDTSKIFSLGIDYNQATLPYICTLVNGGISNIHWSGQRINNKKTILFSNNFLYSQTGLSISLNKCKEILEKRGFICKIVKNRIPDAVTEKFEMEVISPSWRRDIEEPFSIAEEITKTIGYENIEKTLINTTLCSQIDFMSRIKLFLCDRGYTECITNPFSSKGSVIITNPIQSNKKYLRDDLIESLLEVATETFSKGEIFCRIFEIGKVYPSEEEQIAILACGSPRKNFYTSDKFSFFNFKELIYSMSYLIDIKETSVENNHIKFTNGFMKILPPIKLIKNAFYAQFSVKKANQIKIFPLRYNYKNISIDFSGKWQDLNNHLKSFSESCEFLLADVYKNVYTITIKYPYGYPIDEIIEKIK